MRKSFRVDVELDVMNAVEEGSGDGSEIMMARSAVTPPPRECPHITRP